MPTGALQYALGQGRTQKRPRRVVDQNDLILAGKPLETPPDGVLALGAPCDYLEAPRPTQLCDFPTHLSDPAARHDHHAPPAVLPERGEAVQVHGPPVQGKKLFGNPRPETRPRPRRGQDQKAQRRETFSRKSPRCWVVSPVWNLPKIILPAVVCSTLVTWISMFLPIMRRALSTTTMVPSSR